MFAANSIDDILGLTVEDLAPDHEKERLRDYLENESPKLATVVEALWLKSAPLHDRQNRPDSNENGRIDSRDRIVKTGAMSWFAGYAPRDKARIAFAVLLEYAPSASGGRLCGPLAVELVDHCLARGYLR